MIPSDLVTSWREEAARLRARYGDDRLAQLCETHAAELETAIIGSATDLLNLQQAARASGYSADRLSRLVREGKIPNFGRKHAPRVRRGDLPIRPGAAPGVARKTPGIPSIGAVGRQAMRSRAGG